ncbi:hypothetical protein [Candidatus Fokinia crypta]|uniref:Uncharacterized protein n=1 Tax=Candidatus Fokinia crypta TaxID=1920990 RepID=A0ABZ0UQH6_9RICK|nr:hypothetical protein [Candidatus Fokinia cryptica]WPX97954.1 hypothetical protein Fokcrypt_00479 [Candidatus Fokinia cryptica]
MINKTNPSSTKGFLDHNVIRKCVHEFCDEILFYSPEVLEFIFQKKGIFSLNELVQNYPQILQFPEVKDGIEYLYCLIVKGRASFLPQIWLGDEIVNSMVSSIARPIFMEEVQMMLQSQGYVTPNNNSSNLQQSQQAAAPSLEHTITEDETHDSDNDLSDL